MERKKRTLSRWNVLLLAVCIILAITLAGLLAWDAATVREESERLKAEAAGQEEIYVPAAETGNEQGR